MNKKLVLWIGVAAILVKANVQAEALVAGNPLSPLYLSLNAIAGKGNAGEVFSTMAWSSSFNVDPMNRFSLKENTYGIDAAVGKRFDVTTMQVRVDINYNYYGKISGSVSPAFPPAPLGIPTYTSSVQTEVKSQAIFANAYAQKKLTPAFFVYMGAGGGRAFHKAKTTMSADVPPLPLSDRQRHHSSDFAWKMMLGGLYFITPKVAFNIAYVHANLGRITYGTFYTHLPSVPGRKLHSGHWVGDTVNVGIQLYT